MNKIVLNVATLEMRTELFQICLLNDASQKPDTSFILSRKEWGVDQTERENG